MTTRIYLAGRIVVECEDVFLAEEQLFSESGARMEDGIANLGVAKAAWMRDTEKNLMPLVQLAV